MFYLPLSLFNFISLLNFFYSPLHNFIIFPPQCFYSLLLNFYYFPSSILIDFLQITVYLTLFVLNGISCLILLLAIISRVFNQLILVKLLIVL